MPYGAALRLTDYERSRIGPTWPILHAFAWGILIGGVAIALWRRRVRVRGSATGSQEAMRAAR